MADGPIYMKILLIGAWFIQMGAHEGAHAHMAYRCGDDTASLLGKRSFNPLNHVEWTNINSILFSVIVPSLTAYYYMFPMGMAWVPVNVRRLRSPGKDMAKIAFVGPLANLVVAAVCLVLHLSLGMLGLSNEDTVGLMRFAWLCDQFLFAIGFTSIIYGFFNLVPIPPLDGAKVLRHFLPRGGQDVMDNIAPYGMMLIVMLFWVGDLGQIFLVPMSIFVQLWGFV